MKKFLKPKFLFLVFWIVVVFVGIAALPNVQSLIDNHQSQTSSQVSTAKLTKLQNKWGRGLAHTDQLVLVFNNQRTKLLPSQQTKIDKALTQINKKAKYYGIKQIRTIHTSTNDQQLLTSNDGSTELAVVSIDTQQSELKVVANQLNDAAKVSGLKTYVTSTNLIAAQRQQAQLNHTITILVIGAICALLLLGIIFRSLLIPLINLLIQTIALITTTSIAANAVDFWRLPFAGNSVLIVGIVVLVLSTVLTWSYMSDYLANAEDADSLEADALATLALQFKKWLIVLISLALMAVGLSFTALPAVASSWIVALAVVLTTLAVPTLNYTFAALLGHGLRWPGNRSWGHHPKNLWGQFGIFSSWKPVLGWLVALILIVPGLWFARAQFSYDSLTPDLLATTTNAEDGNQVITAHFGAGAATPVVINVNADHNLTTQNNLQTLDALTTKLQHVAGVKSVVSVTQPTGQKVAQYYVGNQLATINANLAVNQKDLKKIQKQLKNNQETLTSAQVGQQIKALKKLQKQINKLSTYNERISSSLVNTEMTAGNITGKNKRSRSALRTLNRELNKADSLVADITDLTSTVQMNQDSVVSMYTDTNTKLKSVKKRLAKTVKLVGTVNSSVNSTSTYLASLKASEVGKAFYIPDDAYNSDLFQNSLTTNTSKNGKQTQLIVTFKTAPTSTTSFHALSAVKQTVNASLLATPLSKAGITYSGETVTQSSIRKTFISNYLKWGLLAFILIGICLWLGLRSIVLSEYLVIGLGVIIMASWGFTRLLYTSFANMGNLPWLTLIWGSILLTLHWLLISTVTVNRKDWLHQFATDDLKHHFALSGRLILPVSLFELVFYLPMLGMPEQLLQSTGVMLVVGIILSNLITPLILPGLIAWTVNPPKLNMKTWGPWFKRHFKQRPKAKKPKATKSDSNTNS
ncbi:MMPL family transporter [Lactiplantibacillus daowaiensis]|uniref:MMPL family transporter n=1 Tax=Lactiplantibacillus daowaiensis TaxID=2559918 RepID=A0ABW1S458_9LACO|nr:MMPL family transporter [Lactiplantibacillus daowaiensis]